jgi:CBS domain-containing protein
MTITAEKLMHETTVAAPDMSIVEIAKVMADKNIGSVLIENPDGIYGIVTERDIIKKVVSKGLDPKILKAADIMSKPVITVDYNADVFKVAGILSEKKIRRLPVVKDGKIIGILTTRDVSRGLVPEFFKELPIFRDIKDQKRKG